MATTEQKPPQAEVYFPKDMDPSKFKIEVQKEDTKKYVNFKYGSDPVRFCGTNGRITSTTMWPQGGMSGFLSVNPEEIKSIKAFIEEPLKQVTFDTLKANKFINSRLEMKEFGWKSYIKKGDEKPVKEGETPPPEPQFYNDSLSFNVPTKNKQIDLKKCRIVDTNGNPYPGDNLKGKKVKEYIFELRRGSLEGEIVKTSLVVCELVIDDAVLPTFKIIEQTNAAVPQTQATESKTAAAPSLPVASASTSTTATTTTPTTNVTKRKAEDHLDDGTNGSSTKKSKTG